MKQNADNNSGKYAKWEDGLAKVGFFLVVLILAAIPLSYVWDSGVISLLALVVAIVAIFITVKNKQAPPPKQRLEQLEELKRSGSLTEEEYAAKRQEILNDL